jgi:hypothetical protein
LHCEEGKKKEKKIDVAIISLSILAFSQKCATLSFLLRWQNANFQKPKINPWSGSVLWSQDHYSGSTYQGSNLVHAQPVLEPMIFNP